MTQDEDILTEIAKDGSVDLDVWPDLVKRLLARLDTIATKNFPKPTPAELAPPSAADVLQAPSAPETSTQPDFSQASTVACVDELSATASLSRPSPAPLVPASSTLTEVATPPPEPLEPAHPSGLHAHDAAVLAELRGVLTNATFSAAPPHTVQRLAELLLRPNAHYSSLPKYLRALQRVLSVSSATTAFPLGDVVQSQQSQQNGVSSNGGGFGLGSDESLGGALLTPIPWLREDAGGEDHALSPPAAGAAGAGAAAVKEVPKLVAEDVGPQPEGTVFPDPPRSEEEIDMPGDVDGGREEEMADAPKERAVAGEGNGNGNGKGGEMQVDGAANETEEQEGTKVQD